MLKSAFFTKKCFFDDFMIFFFFPSQNGCTTLALCLKTFITKSYNIHLTCKFMIGRQTSFNLEKGPEKGGGYPGQVLMVGGTPVRS